MSTTSNHSKAPWAASIVQQHREVFGDEEVIVVRVLEGEVDLKSKFYSFFHPEL